MDYHCCHTNAIAHETAVKSSEKEKRMNNKSVFFVVFAILSASLVFAMGKVDAVDSEISPNTIQKNLKNSDSNYYGDLTTKLRETKNPQERNKILVILITRSDMGSEKDDGLEQVTHDYAVELFNREHTKEDVQAVADHIYKKLSPEMKMILLDAISYSPYKDVTVPLTERIAESDINIRVRIFAVTLLQNMGYEKESLEFAKKIIDTMNETNNIENITIFGAFKSAEIQENAKQYLEKIKTDERKSKAIRVFAVFTSHFNHGSNIEPYYGLLEEVSLDKQTSTSTANYLLPKLAAFGVKDDKLIKILEKAETEGNETVKKIAEKTLVKYKKRLKKKQK